MEKLMTQEKYTRRNFINRSIKIFAAAAIFPFIITKGRKAEGKNPESGEAQSVTINHEEKNAVV